MTFHEPDDRLELYALGRIPASEVAAIEEHLLVCDSCRDRLDEIGAAADGMRRALTSMPAAGAGWFGWRMPQLALAAGLVAVVLAAGIYWMIGGAPVASVASLRLTAMRGADEPSVRVARELDLSFPDAAGTARVVIVDGTGAAVWTGVPANGAPAASIRQTLSPGGYFARVYSPSGQLLHEYAFRVKE